MDSLHKGPVTWIFDDSFDISQNILVNSQFVAEVGCRDVSGRHI